MIRPSFRCGWDQFVCHVATQVLVAWCSLACCTWSLTRRQTWRRIASCRLSMTMAALRSTGGMRMSNLFFLREKSDNKSALGRNIYMQMSFADVTYASSGKSQAFQARSSLEGIPIDRGKYREKTPGKLLPDVQRILSAEAPSGSGSKAIDV